MGFNTVYRYLSEIFPQIDARLLKAVAIEHSKDVDAAANVILTEILPYWVKRSANPKFPEDQSASCSANKEQSSVDPKFPEDQSASCSAYKGQSQGGLSDGDCGAEAEEESTLSRRRRIEVRRRNENVCSSMEPRSISTDTHAHYSDSTCPDKKLNASTVSHFYYVKEGDNQLFGNTEGEEVILLGKTQGNNVEVGSNNVSIVMPCALMNDDGGCANPSQVFAADKGQDINVSEQTPFVMSTPLMHQTDAANGKLTNLKDFDDPLSNDSEAGKNCQVESCLDSPVLEVENSVSQLVLSSVEEHTPEALGCGLQSEIGSGTSITDFEKTDTSGSSDLKSEQENSINENGEHEDESTINTVVTRSGQICKIDLLEEIIEDAKNNKKTLFTAMESIMNMMGEVELKEKAAEEAKAEVARGEFDILIKVEELKQMLVHAKETNDMHAGEVYGEKAILATEARELQTRLLSLSEERDNSLAILDDMRKTLEARLAVAEEERKAAEQEKLEREESARNALAEQEAIMEKVVQESKILQQEAEENSKLREFLMDRGRVVDALQGEISVICQDVRLLKEKFDKRVPLSKSVSSSQTTCILASSGSSMKSLASLVTEQGLTSETPERGSPASSIPAESPKHRLEDERTESDRKELLDDGWDFFDNDTELCGRAV